MQKNPRGGLHVLSLRISCAPHSFIPLPGAFSLLLPTTTFLSSPLFPSTLKHLSSSSLAAVLLPSCSALHPSISLSACPSLHQVYHPNATLVDHTKHSPLQYISTGIPQARESRGEDSITQLKFLSKSSFHSGCRVSSTVPQSGGLQPRRRRQ